MPGKPRTASSWPWSTTGSTLPRAVAAARPSLRRRGPARHRNDLTGEGDLAGELVAHRDGEIVAALPELHRHLVEEAAPADALGGRCREAQRQDAAPHRGGAALAGPPDEGGRDQAL